MRYGDSKSAGLDMAKAASSKTTKPRAVIYARYSTTGQQDISIDAQVNLLRTKFGGDYNIVHIYADRAKSGSATEHRTELNAMKQAAQRREFDVLLVESLDRLSRTLADMAGVCRDLKYWSIKVIAANEGEASNMLIALRGLIGETFTKDVADKVHRQHALKVTAGKIPGAVSYGYRLVAGKPGEREIDPAQVKIVVRIFREFAVGTSPRAIAARLNAESVPSPYALINERRRARGKEAKSDKAWTPHSIINSGNQGIIHNRLYLGEINWNKTCNVKNPYTANLEQRPRDERDWMTARADHLRIIDDGLWEAAHAVTKSRSKARNKTGGRIVPRRKWLLAGLLRCGACGADMRICTSAGGGRIVCAAADKNRAVCQHGRSYDAGQITRLAVRFLRDRFSDPKEMQRFVDLFQQEYAAERKQILREDGQIEKRLAQIEGSIGRFVRALEIGSMPETTIHSKLQELEAEKVVLDQRRKLADKEIETVTLHPTTIKWWRDHLIEIATKLAEGDPEASPALRALVAKVVVQPTAKKRPYKIETFTRFSALSSRFTTRSPTEIAKERGVNANFDSVRSEVMDLNLSKNDETVISLGIAVAATAA
jgi:DNA invertase Pin-like site-specific DNA recombinase